MVGSPKKFPLSKLKSARASMGKESLDARRLFLKREPLAGHQSKTSLWLHMRSLLGYVDFWPFVGWLVLLGIDVDGNTKSSLAVARASAYP